MNLVYKSKWLSVICLLMTISLLPACEKEKDANSGVIELLSFGPAGVKHGEDIQFIGNNLDKVTAIEMVGATIQQASFKQQTSELIVVQVPVEAKSGKVKLITTQGDVVSKSTINFEVPVVITSFPSVARPGEEITITGEYMNWIKEVQFADGKIVTVFTDSSLTELKLLVPIDAKSGPLVFLTGGTEPLTIKSETELQVTLPVATGFAPNPVERGADLTIYGTDLDLTMGILFKGAKDTIWTFVSQSVTQIVVHVPEEANKGKVALIAHSRVVSESVEDLKIVGDLPPLDPLTVTFYDDALENGWQKWGGWGGGSSILDDNNNVRSGEKSIQVIFKDDWGGPLQMGGGNTATAGKTEVSFAIFGEAGTNDKELNILVAGKEKIIKLVEGEWTEYRLPLSDFSNPATINEFTLQSRGWSGTIYIDHIGLR
jgi:hypothetical protein